MKFLASDEICQSRYITPALLHAGLARLYLAESFEISLSLFLSVLSSYIVSEVSTEANFAVLESLFLFKRSGRITT